MLRSAELAIISLMSNKCEWNHIVVLLNFHQILNKSDVMSPSTSGLSVELLLRVIDVKYGYFTLLYFASRVTFSAW